MGLCSQSLADWASTLQFTGVRSPTQSPRIQRIEELAVLGLTKMHLLLPNTLHRYSCSRMQHGFNGCFDLYTKGIQEERIHKCLGYILLLTMESPLQQYMSTTIMKKQSTKTCTDDPHHLWLHPTPTQVTACCLANRV